MENGVANEKPLFWEFWEHQDCSYQRTLPHEHVDNLTFCTVTGQWHPHSTPKLNYVVFILEYCLPHVVYTPCLRHKMVIQQELIFFYLQPEIKMSISASSLSCQVLGHNCLMLAMVNLMLVTWCEYGVNRCICTWSFGLRMFHVTMTTLSDIMNIHKTFFHCY